MARCPECEKKKGKRYCPARDTQICSTCCATKRLGEIQCPQDCEYLQSEYYQLERRGAKARSHGKALIAELHDLYYTDDRRDYAFQLLADAFWWIRNREKPTNAAFADSIDTVASRLSAVVLPSSGDELGDFLAEVQAKSGRYATLEEHGMDQARKRETLEGLAKRMRGHSPPEDLAVELHDQSYWELVASYFGELDFEADLDYSPAEEIAEADGQVSPGDGYEERSSGLVLPGE